MRWCEYLWPLSTIWNLVRFGCKIDVCFRKNLNVILVEMMNEEQIKTDTWSLSIDEDGILIFPDELLQTVGWVEGDELEFTENVDGSFLITKVNETASN